MELELPSPLWLPLFEKNRAPIIIVNGVEVEGAFDRKRRIINPENGLLIPEHRIVDRGHKRTRYYVAWGGRGAGKSLTFGLAAILRAMEEKQTILCCRQIQSSIADSVLSTLDFQIKDLKLENEFDVLVNAIRHKKTGTNFVFRGLKHNIKEIKSLNNTKICWIEEATDVTKETFIELDPTIRAPDAEIWIGFNTGLVDDFIYKRFVLTPDDDVTLIPINYTDNALLGRELLHLAEKMKEMDYEEYLNVWLGQPKIARNGGVFKPENIKIVPVAPVCVKFCRGWDFAASSVIDGKDPDWSTGGLIGITSEGQYVIMNMVRFRDTPDVVERVLLSTASQDGLIVEQSLPQDPGSAGKAHVLYLTKKLSGYRVHTSPESGDKVTRAEPLASQVNVGNVVMVQGAWNEALIKEMAGFNGDGKAKDDQVDCLSRAFHRLQTNYSMQFATITGL